MTTLEYSSTEKSLGDWGFALDSCQCQHVNLAASRYSGTVPGASVSDTPLFAFEGKVIIRRNRSGSGTTWSGGYVAFIGYAMPPSASQDGAGAGVRYDFENAWYFLENICYQQYVASYNTTSHALEYKPVSEVILFTKLDGSNILVHMDSGEQIDEALTFANTQCVAADIATPIIIGTIDPAINFPIYQTREIMCDAVIQKSLSMSPDVVALWDYSTDIAGVPTPTVHFYSRTSRTAKSLTILNGTDHRFLLIIPRDDLVVRGVIIQYKITGSADGSTWILNGEAQKDKYGPNRENNALDPDGGLRVLLQTIDLQGSQYSSVSADIECIAVDANAGATTTDATRLAWWKKKVQWLNSDKIAGLNIATATIVDDSGSSWTLASYPNELTRGQIANWMSFTQKWVTITAKADYAVYSTAAAATAATASLTSVKQFEKEISVRILITDATTGFYSAPASYIGGDSMPTGIAKAIYESLSFVQYQGEDVRVQEEIMNAAGDGPFVHLGHKLNLTGGLSAWTTMDAQIQSITEHDGRGATSISFGPAKHLNAGDLSALFQWNVFRHYWYNPLLRETADVTAGGAVTLGEDLPKENTAAGSGTRNVIAATHEL